jgi:hypothetical protein
MRLAGPADHTSAAADAVTAALLADCARLMDAATAPIPSPPADDAPAVSVRRAWPPPGALEGPSSEPPCAPISSGPMRAAAGPRPSPAGTAPSGTRRVDSRVSTPAWPLAIAAATAVRADGQREWQTRRSVWSTTSPSMEAAEA